MLQASGDMCSKCLRLARYGFSFFLVLISLSCFSQKLITGIVVDSASLEPLVNVHILNITTGRGTVSDSNGKFAMMVSFSDTLVFSSIGYGRSERTAWAEDDVLIRLSQQVRVLDEVKVEETPIKIDVPEVPKPGKFDKFQNNTYNPPPGQVATFGPGIVIPLGGRKDRKMKDKLEKTREENNHAKVYVTTINSPDVKDVLMKKYELTEDQYYRWVQEINLKHPDLVYNLSASDLKNLIFNYFENNIK